MFPFDRVFHPFSAPRKFRVKHHDGRSFVGERFYGNLKVTPPIKSVVNCNGWDDVDVSELVFDITTDERAHYASQMSSGTCRAGRGQVYFHFLFTVPR